MKMMTTKADLIYTLCREEILTGALPPGFKIQQEQLAERLGASITPLREALRRLQSEGLIVAEAHRDAHVALLSKAELLSLFETRKPLDGQAAALAALRRSSRDLAQMESALEKLGSNPEMDWSEVVSLNYRFHRSVWLASQNQVLIPILESLWARCERYRRLGAFVHAGDKIHDQHQREHVELFEAVKRGDAERAGAIMASHTQATLDDLSLRIDVVEI